MKMQYCQTKERRKLQIGIKKNRGDEVKKQVNPGICLVDRQKDENDFEQNLHKDKCAEKFYKSI